VGEARVREQEASRVIILGELPPAVVEATDVPPQIALRIEQRVLKGFHQRTHKIDGRWSSIAPLPNGQFSGIVRSFLGAQNCVDFDSSLPIPQNRAVRRPAGQFEAQVSIHRGLSTQTSKIADERIYGVEEIADLLDYVGIQRSTHGDVPAFLAVVDVQTATVEELYDASLGRELLTRSVQTVHLVVDLAFYLEEGETRRMAVTSRHLQCTKGKDVIIRTSPLEETAIGIKWRIEWGHAKYVIRPIRTAPFLPIRLLVEKTCTAVRTPVNALRP
jgi:hypothetical protein